MERRLINLQRRELHDIIVHAGIDPSIARWTDDKKGWTSAKCETIEIGLCYFLFNPDPDGVVNIKMRPAHGGGVEIGEVGLPWSAVLRYFLEWASRVKQEIETEDPWARYAAFMPPERVGKHSDNSPFTFGEAQAADRAVTLLLKYLTDDVPQYAGTAERFSQSFENLTRGAKSGAGRIDWSNQFVGLIISLCLTLSLSPDQAANIWRRWIEIVSNLLPTP